ncbi:MAG: molybdenum cofactor biosynthesis protein B [Thermoplasmata archaeon]
MGTEEHKKKSPISVECAVVTVSDTRTVETDESGGYIVDALKKAGHNVIGYMLVKDDRMQIKGAVDELMKNRTLDVIIINGGTGISQRDVTIETIAPMLDKKLEGFGELFRMLSYQEIGSAAMMSRALGGLTTNGIAIFCLPGSPNAVRLGLEKILLPELGHVIFEARR